MPSSRRRPSPRPTWPGGRSSSTWMGGRPVTSEGKIDLTDVVAALGFLFQGHPASIECPRSADIDDSGRLDVSDPIHLPKDAVMGGGAPARALPPPRPR